MTTLYRVRDWDKHFENSQSRKYGAISWVPMPNKHDGKSFRRLMRMKGGLTFYGAWVLIVQVASKCPNRGTLADEDGPLSAEDISLKCDATEAEIEKAMEVLSSPAIGWLEVVSDQTGSTLPVDSQHAPSGAVAGRESTTLNRTELKEQKEKKLPVAPQERNRTGLGTGRVEGFDGEKLGDTSAVLSWLTRNGSKLGLDPEHHETRLRTLAAAQHAAGGESPGGLFLHLMKTKAAGDDKRPWSKLGDDDLQAGKARLREFTAATSKPHPAVLAMAGKRIAGGPTDES